MIYGNKLQPAKPTVEDEIEQVRYNDVSNNINIELHVDL